MMKVKVVDNYDYKTVEVIEADTIENLKAQIMKCFSLTENDLKKRLLVRDARVIPNSIFFSPMPMMNGFDLLELEEGSILKDYLCSNCLDDDDPLLLGWKGPFFISLVSPHRNELLALDASINIMVKHDDTVQHLNSEIEKLTGEKVTGDNLPTFLSSKRNQNKPLIFFGFYKYCKEGFNCSEMLRFYIHRNKDNTLVSGNSDSGLMYLYLTEPEMPRYFGVDYDRVVLNEAEAMRKFKFSLIDQYDYDILVPRTELNKIEGMEGDKEDAGPSFQRYQFSMKERKYIDGTMKRRKNKRGRKHFKVEYRKI